MSGVEVAGLVLGGIPLVISAVEHYSDFLTGFKASLRYGDTLKELKLNLDLQERQLARTLLRIGIDDDFRKSSSPADLYNFIKIEYPEDSEMILGVVNRIGDTISTLLDKLDVDLLGKPRWTESGSARVQWEWRRVRRGFGHKEREQLINQLQRYNTAFANCFERHESKAATPSVFDFKRCDIVRADVRAFHKALDHGCIHPHNVHFCPGDGIEMPPRFDVVFTMLDASNELLQWTKVHLEDNPAPTPAPSYSTLPPTLQLTSKNSPQSPTNKQAETFSAVLPTHSRPCPPPDHTCMCDVLFSASDSAIFIQCPIEHTHRRRRASISKFPYTQPCRQPFHLRSVLKQTRHRTLRLSLKERFQLAAALSWMVLHLDGSPWLDADLDLEELHLFSEGEPTQRRLLRQPFLMHRFATDQKPTLPPDLPDQHPKEEQNPWSLDRNLVSNRVLFALGLVLIELALDRSLSSLRADHLAETGRQISDFELARDHLDWVYDAGGEEYGEAVQRCIKCDFPVRPSRTGFEWPEFRREFYAGVVEPLRRTASLMPASCRDI